MRIHYYAVGDTAGNSSICEKDLAVSKGKKVIIDPAPAVPDLPDEFWKNVTLIKPNETEIGILREKSFYSGRRKRSR